MAKCKECIHEKVCLHRANIQNDTYAYMGVKYDTEKCIHYIPVDVEKDARQFPANCELKRGGA